MDSLGHQTGPGIVSAGALSLVGGGGMTDLQVPSCTVQATPFEEVAGHWRALRMAKTARPPVRGLRFQCTSVGGRAVERGDRGFVLGQEGGQFR
jgi:hypothetical protein